ILFLGFLIIILVLPLWIDTLLSAGEQGIEVQGEIVNVLLARPLGGILTILGIENTVEGPYIEFIMANGSIGSVGIAASCAGIYSLGIFLSAYIAFILSEFSSFTRRIGILLIVGIAFTYLANLLRMTIIIIAGYYNGIGYGLDPEPFTLLWTHKYIGEIIFIFWVAIFWWLAFNYLGKEEIKKQRDSDFKKVDDTESIDAAEIKEDVTIETDEIIKLDEPNTATDLQESSSDNK
ncbi:MAG: exosortase/archaeosortase family protein, partial [Thermoplasmata archaeon]|nr:exosortase/archaeosortase family protein [Thermoplasmata archaeon]